VYSDEIENLNKSIYETLTKAKKTITKMYLWGPLTFLKKKKW